MSLRIFLLGAPRVERADGPVEFDTRKAVALLAYLAVTGEIQARESLVNLLWPEYDASSARAAFRRTLSTLKKALGEGFVRSNRETISLSASADLWVDVNHFRTLLAEASAHLHPDGGLCSSCLEKLQQAVALYHADFLSGFALRDSLNFDDWQFFQADSLRQELAIALEKLTRSLALQGDYHSAIAHARRWLALDPLREEAHRWLMQLYEWSDQHAAALRQYRACVRSLDQELSVEPLDETVHLYQAILEHRLAPLSRTGRGEKEISIPSGEAESSYEASPTHLPFVGREKELTLLWQAYRSVKVDGNFLVLEGEVGIGKTRLAQEFLQRVNQEGARVLTARCYEGEMNLAYAPILEALRKAAASPGFETLWKSISPAYRAEAMRLLPELAGSTPEPMPPAAEGPGAQGRFMEGLSQVLVSLCQGGQPGVLFVDDLHWADSATQDLLTYLVHRLAGRPIFILVTCRGEALETGHPCQSLVSGARRAELGTSLALSRLDQTSVNKLLEAAGKTSMGSGLPERLFLESEGLPFFVVEYLSILKDHPLEPGESWSLPLGVRELLRSRLAPLSETSNQLLTTAAVIGRSFDLNLLRYASGRSELETVEGLEQLLALGLIKESSLIVDQANIRYDFTHDKLRALIYEQASLARRYLLHLRVAEGIANQGRGGRPDPALAGVVAYHYRAAGQNQLAAEFFQVAGEHARRLYANGEALAHFREALALGHPQAAGLHEAIGDLLTLQGEYSEAVTGYETAASLDPSGGSFRLEHKLADVHYRRGALDQAECHYELAWDLLTQNGPAEARARLLADWSRNEHHRGFPDRALKFARQALELADANADPQALALVHNILGILARSQGNPAEAIVHLKQSLTLAEGPQEIGGRVAALNNLALAYGDEENWPEATQHAEAALALCIQLGDRHREAALHNNLADFFHAAGQTEQSNEHLKQAVAIFSEVGMEAGSMKPEIWMLTEW